MLNSDWLIQKLASQTNIFRKHQHMTPGLKYFKKSFIFRYFMAHFVDNDSERERSGRKRRVDPFKESQGFGLRVNDSAKLPEFEIFLKWLKSSCLTPVPVKTLQQVLEDPRELAVIQERVATLSSEDEETLRKLHSLDDLPETWKEVCCCQTVSRPLLESVRE